LSEQSERNGQRIVELQLDVENFPSPDNPKTSYLATLSAIPDPFRNYNLEVICIVCPQVTMHLGVACD
jgi:hypothetical protein